MVPRIEGLQPQLKLQPLRECKVLEDTDVPVVDSWHGDGIAANTSESVWRRLGIVPSVKPFVQPLGKTPAASDFIGAVRAKRIKQAGRVGARNRHGKAL